MTTDRSPEGFIYILHNMMFSHVGEDVYKIGKTQDIAQRLRSYTTSYLHPCSIKFSSEKCNDHHLAENIVKHRLKDYRLARTREFFQGDLTHFITVINDIVKAVNDSDEGIQVSIQEMSECRRNKPVDIEKIKEQRRIHYENNKERRLEYYKKHKDRIRTKDKEYKEKHKERYRAQAKEPKT